MAGKFAEYNVSLMPRMGRAWVTISSRERLVLVEPCCTAMVMSTEFGARKKVKSRAEMVAMAFLMIDNPSAWK